MWCGYFSENEPQHIMNNHYMKNTLGIKVKGIGTYDTNTSNIFKQLHLFAKRGPFQIMLQET